MPNKDNVRVIGIDPGYGRLGICIVEKGLNKKEEVIYSNCIETGASEDIYSRFLDIGKAVGKVIDQFKPSEMALESLFISKNKKTAMRVAEVRGIVIFQGLSKDLTIHEYTPLQIKMAITGDGTSDKSRIIKMIHLLTKITKKIKLDDEYDAIAVALTHFARKR